MKAKLPSRKRTWARLLPVVLAASSIGILGVPARSAELPAEVREALEQSCAAILPLDVHWTMQRTSPLPRAELLRLLEQPNAHRLLTVTEFRFAMQADKFHSWEQHKDGKKWELRELAFDTQCFYESHGTAMHIVNEAIRKRGPHNQAFVPGYLVAAGIFIPNTYHTFGQPPQSRLLHLLDDGGALERVANETVQAVACLRVDVTHKDRSHRFFLDPALHYAVRQQEEWSGAERISVTKCEQFQKMKPPLHLPRYCRTDYFDYYKHSLPDRARPLITETFTVSKIDQSPLPETRFVITPEVGMYVSDSRLPEARDLDDSGFASYVMPAKPEDMQQAIDKASAELRAARASQKRAGWQLYSVTTAVAAGIVAIIVGAAYLGLRWRAARD